MVMKNYIQKILNDSSFKVSSPSLDTLSHPRLSAFAPTNIALCKYWGKRDKHLNLPVTNSLSISLGDYGTTTCIKEIDSNCDQIIVNGIEALEKNQASFSADMSLFRQRLTVFLDCFRVTSTTRFCIETTSNIPIAAGLASSACGFAALVKALNNWYRWNLTPTGLSLIARLGSGSACRSLWHGFVEWERGERIDGFDSVGVPIETQWPALRVGILMVDQKQKPISSRAAMLETQKTSPFYACWPEKVTQDLDKIKTAIKTQDFQLLAETSEANALAMHALMLTATPSIMYMTPETVRLMQQIWHYRAAGLRVYFTQDAGPNLKLLFLESDTKELCEKFPELKVIDPFKHDEK
jgi:diphosphomevalonate decarboxylase